MHWLTLHGHEACHVNNIGLGSAADIEIAAYAVANDMILISKDDDFLRLQPPDRFVLLWLRCGNTTNASLGLWLEARWQKVVALLDDGERIIELR